MKHDHFWTLTIIFSSIHAWSHFSPLLKGPRPRPGIDLHPAPTDPKNCDEILDQNVNFYIDERISALEATDIRQYVEKFLEYTGQYSYIYSKNHLKLEHIYSLRKNKRTDRGLNWYRYNLSEDDLGKVLGQSSNTVSDTSKGLTNILNRYISDNDSRATGTFFIHAEVEIRKVLQNLQTKGYDFDILKLKDGLTEAFMLEFRCDSDYRTGHYDSSSSSSSSPDCPNLKSVFLIPIDMSNPTESFDIFTKSFCKMDIGQRCDLLSNKISCEGGGGQRRGQRYG